ncbi:hypothetical protein BGW80DRAFT_1315079 [Lactifluus volemus]|nr:hypothetical protein BGW80DRAFT_1315079 [Lactifluus volemus]
MPHNPPMAQPEGPEHQTLIVGDHEEANSQGTMFPILSALLLSDFTTYVFIRCCLRPDPAE